MSDGSLLPDVPKEIIALWGEADEKASEDWREKKRKDFADGGAAKEKHGTLEALEEWMKTTVYGPKGTMDKTLKIRGNPRVYFDITLDGVAAGRVVMQLRKDVVPKTAENFPYQHGKQSLSRFPPVTFRCVPGGHPRHRVEPVSFANVPIAHGTHCVLFFARPLVGLY